MRNIENGYTMTNVIKRSKASLCVAAALMAVSSFSFADTVSLDNAGFESGWDNWTASGAALSSSDVYEGDYSAKITSTSGLIERTVTVEANTTYILSAYVLGGGTIGANVGSETYSSNIDSDDWTQVSVEFETDSSTSITIFAEYYSEENGRVDSFSLESTGSTDTELTIVDVSDDGLEDEYSTSEYYAIDGDESEDSRWSSLGLDSYITFDLNDTYTVDEIAILWYKGTERNYYFDVAVATEWGEFTDVLKNETSAGDDDYETYDLGGVEARYVRVRGNTNSVNNWNAIIESKLFGSTVASDTDSDTDPDDGTTDPDTDTNVDTDYGLDADAAPSENFDLSAWYLSVPTDTDDSGTADSIKEAELNDGYESEYFYTGDDGAMVFVCTVGGYKTSSNTSYTRTELREMLRAGDTSVDTDSPENNWAFSSIDDEYESDFGGINGTLEATLAVNYVTTTSSNEEQVGRVIIGQIHAEDNEPIRLYYHKQPGNTKGAVYFAHEPSVEGKAAGVEEKWYNLVGEMIADDNEGYADDITDEPSDGFELDEQFSYKIEVDGDMLMVTISQDGSEVAYKEVDMSTSLYDDEDNYMFFKAGIYLNDKTSDDDDYAKVSFYELSNSHENYDN